MASAWETEGGPPDAIFYPRETLDQTTTEELEIVATAEYTNEDEVSLPLAPPLRAVLLVAALSGVVPMEARLASLP